MAKTKTSHHTDASFAFANVLIYAMWNVQRRTRHFDIDQSKPCFWYRVTPVRIQIPENHYDKD